MKEILFPLGGVRLSTVLFIAAFVALAITRHDRVPILACFAWLSGFEVFFESVGLSFQVERQLGPLHAVFWIIFGSAIVLVTWRADIRPSLPFLLVAIFLFGIWVATGFHVNEHDGLNFDPIAELLNESSKILWALAYFLPLGGVLKDRVEHEQIDGQSV